MNGTPLIFSPSHPGQPAIALDVEHGPWRFVPIAPDADDVADAMAVDEYLREPGETITVDELGQLLGMDI